MGLTGQTSWSPEAPPPSDAATLRRIARLAFTFDVRDALATVTPPLTVLAGEKEMRDIQESLRMLAAASETTQAAYAPGGHAWPAVSHDLFVATVRAFLDAEPLPDALRRI